MKTNQIINLKLGEKHVVELKGGGTKGYQWIAFPDSSNILSIEKKYSEKGLSKKLLGFSANEIFTITALAKGKATIRIKQLETWKVEPRVINEFVYKIVVS
jgi:predicted secreted protein